MLAPRETLWAAPREVAEAALELLGVHAADTLCDYGCGDGVALLAAAERFGCRAVGYEIHRERAHALQLRVAAAGLGERVHVRAANALECDADEPTCVYLYLIERGLKLMLPLLQRAAARQPEGYLRVVTVLYRIPGVGPPVRTLKHVVSPTVMFPLHLYHIRAAPMAAASGSAADGGGAAAHA